MRAPPVLLLWLGLAFGLTLSLGGCDRPGPDPADAGIDVGQALGGATPHPSFARATEPRAFEFPADHGAHPDFRNEWWYFTGHLANAEGRRFGFQFTLFRIAVTPPAQRHARSSDWAADQVYMGHFALSDLDAAEPPRFHAFERFARGAAGLAGARETPLAIWLEDWRVDFDGEGDWRIRAAADGISLDLHLRTVGGILLQGDQGLSQKSAQPGNASYYYSVPRLRAEGQVRIGESSESVEGLAWLDREWSTSALGPDQAGWDWFSLQFDDGGVLMYYQLRGRDGSVDPHSAGVYQPAGAEPRRILSSQLQLAVTRRWESPRGGVYPAGWRMDSALLPHTLVIRPLLADQELDLSVRYWEGAVAVEDEQGRRLGQGYVELTGYAE